MRAHERPLLESAFHVTHYAAGTAPSSRHEGGNQTAPLATVIRHDSLWKCRPPTRSEGAPELARGVGGWGADEIGAAPSLGEGAALT
jgi:hypothetical protein